MNDKLKFFDCNCSLGRRFAPSSEEFYNVNRLIEEMEYSGISRSLAYHSLAKEYNPDVGNECLLEEIKGIKEIEPCWVLLPSYTKETLNPEEMIKKMLNNKVRAARTFPKEHNFSLEEWNIGDLFSVLNDHKIPLFLDLDQTRWKEIYNICSHYSQMPLILSNVDYRIDRYLYPLLGKFNNLYIEISHYSVFRGIETICKNFGASHLLFGTRLPIFEAGSALNMLNFAHISQIDKQLISYENLDKLLREVK